MSEGFKNQVRPRFYTFKIKFNCTNFSFTFTTTLRRKTRTSFSHTYISLSELRTKKNSISSYSKKKIICFHRANNWVKTSQIKIFHRLDDKGLSTQFLLCIGFYKTAKQLNMIYKITKNFHFTSLVVNKICWPNSCFIFVQTFSFIPSLFASLLETEKISEIGRNWVEMGRQMYFKVNTNYASLCYGRMEYLYLVDFLFSM